MASNNPFAAIVTDDLDPLGSVIDLKTLKPFDASSELWSSLPSLIFFTFKLSIDRFVIMTIQFVKYLLLAAAAMPHAFSSSPVLLPTPPMG
jgi:hypothetical protein